MTEEIKGNPKISDLIIYPIKSSSGLSTSSVKVINLGLENDRGVALINSNNKIITARENAKLLQLYARIENDILSVSDGVSDAHSVNLNDSEFENLEVVIFKDTIEGKVIKSSASNWISKIIGEPCQLVRLSSSYKRRIKAKFGAKEKDEISFTDAAPILLTSEESLYDLNGRLDQPIAMERFRPNIVVQGGVPYEEDTWKHIKIGPTEYDVIYKCRRCVFTTIDTKTLEKDINQEPIRTLSTYRIDDKGGVAFGVYLVPRKLGDIEIGQSIICR